MKRGLLLVVVLLAVASLMAAMAFNTANITNAGEMQIKNTSESLITLTEHRFYTGEVGNKDNTVIIENGKMKFRFGFGRDGATFKMYGQQKDSEYIWNSPFQIVNNSAETLEITLTATGDMAPYVFFGSNGSGVIGTSNWHQTTFTYTATLNYGARMTPPIRIYIPGDDASSLGTMRTGTILVTARAQ